VVLNRGRKQLSVTWWVCLFTWPIISYVFGTVSFFTILANLAVLFLVEAITVLGFIGSILGLIWNLGGSVILNVTYPFLRYLIEVVDGLGTLGGVVVFRFNWCLMLGWYLLLGTYWYAKIKK